MAKLPEPNKYKDQSSKISSKSDPISNAIGLMKERRKTSEGRKTTSDVVGQIAQQSNESLKGSTRGWRSVASGITKGIKNASDLTGIAEREEYSKSNSKVMDYLEAMNNQALEAKMENENQEKARLAVTPDYFAYDSAVKKGADPQTRLTMVNSMLKRASDITGKNFIAVDTLSNDPNMAVIQDPTTGDNRVVNIPSLIFGDQYNQGAMASLDPDYQMRLQEERQRYDQEQALEERKVGSLEGVNLGKMAKYGAEINKLNREADELAISGSDGGVKIPQKSKSDYIKIANQSANSIERSKSAKKAMLEMSELSEKWAQKEEEGGSDINSFYNRYNPIEKWNSEEAQTDMGRFEKLRNNIGNIKARQMRSEGILVTQEIKKGIMAEIPNWNQTPDARADNIRTKLADIDSEIKWNTYKEDTILKKNEIPSYADFERLQKGSVSSQTIPSQPSSDMVPVIINGVPGKISREEYNKKMNNNGQQ